MTDREKLMELLYGHSIDTKEDVEYVADHLLANGVTVQEWIPATEPPAPFVSVLVHVPCDDPFPTVHEGYIANDGTWVVGMYKRDPYDVVKWKPMPEAPKED